MSAMGDARRWRSLGRLLTCGILMFMAFPRAGDHPIWLAVRVLGCLFVLLAAYDTIRELLAPRGRDDEHSD